MERNAGLYPSTNNEREMACYKWFLSGIEFAEEKYEASAPVGGSNPPASIPEIRRLMAAAKLGVVTKYQWACEEDILCEPVLILSHRIPERILNKGIDKHEFSRILRTLEPVSGNLGTFRRKLQALSFQALVELVEYVLNTACRNYDKGETSDGRLVEKELVTFDGGTPGQPHAYPKPGSAMDKLLRDINRVRREAEPHCIGKDGPLPQSGNPAKEMLKDLKEREESRNEDGPVKKSDEAKMLERAHSLQIGDVLVSGRGENFGHIYDVVSLFQDTDVGENGRGQLTACIVNRDNIRDEREVAVKYIRLDGLKGMPLDGPLFFRMAF